MDPWKWNSAVNFASMFQVPLKWDKESQCRLEAFC